MELIKDGKNCMYNVRTEEGFKKFLDYLKHDIERVKTMVLSPGSLSKFDSIIKSLRYILDISEEEYSLEVEKCELFPEKIYITVKTDCFSVPNYYYDFFKDVINNADGFSSRPIGAGRVEYNFDIANMYTEV